MNNYNLHLFKNNFEKFIKKNFFFVELYQNDSYYFII